MRITITAVYDEDEAISNSRVIAKLKDLHLDYNASDEDARRHLQITGYIDGEDELLSLVASMKASRLR